MKIPFILALAAALERLQPVPPTAAELQEFEARCRRAGLMELGDLLWRARTDAHNAVAERVATERLAAEGEKRAGACCG